MVNNSHSPIRPQIRTCSESAIMGAAKGSGSKGTIQGIASGSIKPLRPKLGKTEGWSGVLPAHLSKQAKPSCPKGTARNPQSHKCSPVPANVCPYGSAWSDMFKGCIPA